MSDFTPRPTPDEEWEALLHHWRTQPDAQPRPLFYNRVRARLVGEVARGPQPLPIWLRWPSYAVMLGIILMLSGDGAVERSDESGSQYPMNAAGR
jgi:hypothetical protein